jgi:hypothetical protein
MYHLDMLHPFGVYLASKFYPSETPGLRVPARCMRRFCASTADVVCRDADVFGTQTLSSNRIL